MLRARRGEEVHPPRLEPLAHLPSACLEFTSSHWAVAGGAGSKPPFGTESCAHCCWSMRLACCHSEEVRNGFSVPWVSPVLLVVELQLDLIFDLIDEDLG